MVLTRSINELPIAKTKEATMIAASNFLPLN
jgi:hypothetical protein